MSISHWKLKINSVRKCRPITTIQLMIPNTEPSSTWRSMCKISKNKATKTSHQWVSNLTISLAILQLALAIEVVEIGPVKVPRSPCWGVPYQGTTNPGLTSQSTWIRSFPKKEASCKGNRKVQVRMPSSPPFSKRGVCLESIHEKLRKVWLNMLPQS